MLFFPNKFNRWLRRIPNGAAAINKKPTKVQLDAHIRALNAEGMRLSVRQWQVLRAAFPEVIRDQAVDAIRRVQGQPRRGRPSKQSSTANA
jgi:hypothetical protein